MAKPIINQQLEEIRDAILGLPTSGVQEAVDEWLDEHPEATTTVQDESLTKEKFSPMLTLQAIKDYVTPQMYGAKADGETDDTEAIQTALDSGHDVFFPTGTYMTSGVDITREMTLFFAETTLKANTDWQDHVISTSNKITVKGTLYIKGDNKAYCGFKFSSALRSHVDYLYVEYCKAWGVYVYYSGAMLFKYLHTQYCGTKMTLTVSSTGASEKPVTINSISEDNKTLLNSSYFSECFGYDASGYTVARYTKIGRMFDGYDDENQQLMLKTLGGNRLPADYISKDFVLLFGGGLLIGDHSFMQCTVLLYNSLGNATGITFVSPYGHQIVSFYSQHDGVPMYIPSYSQGNHISSITCESPNSGYISVSYNYDHSVIDVIGTNGTGAYNTSAMLSIANINYENNGNTPFLLSATRRAVPRQYNTTNNVTLDELSSDLIFADRTSKFIIKLQDTYSGASPINFWGAKTLLIAPSSAQSNNITITLHNDTVSAGFSLEGATNNVLTIARPSSTAEFKLIIVLKNSTFKVYMENMPSLVTPVS